MNPNEENETELLDNSMYYNDNNFKITLQNSHNRLSMVSQNCQSINAKFDQLKLFLADINSDSPISVICIQETWGHEGIDMTAFSLPNYAMVYENRRLTAHGGLMIYIHDEFHYRNLNRDIEITNTSDLFESLIVEICRRNNKYQKYLIGNIYRLPNYTSCIFLL